MLSATNLIRDVAAPGGGTRRILGLPALNVAKGDHTLVHGPSGCGKSTLLALLGGLMRPTSGDICYEGRPYHTLTRRDLDALRAQSFGFVFQRLHLIGHLTLAQNLALACRNASPDEGRLQSLLARLGLTHLQHQRAARLSHGEAQRTAILRALLPSPAILFADEPTSALDDANAAAVMTLLAETADESGTTLVVATHDSRIKPFFRHVLDLAPC